jgi:predicted RNA-binding Zn ribbon-like protein
VAEHPHAPETTGSVENDRPRAAGHTGSLHLNFPGEVWRVETDDPDSLAAAGRMTTDHPDSPGAAGRVETGHSDSLVAAGQVETDHLGSPEGLLHWARLAEIIDESETSLIEAAWIADPSTAEAALTDTLALRALIDPALAGSQLDTLTHRWSQAIARSALSPGRNGAADLRVGMDPAWTIPDRLADALVDLVRTADRTRLRACPLDQGGCGWLFLDRSRNGTRRWCSMEDCGTHAKTRRLTERRRAHRTT